MEILKGITEVNEGDLSIIGPSGSKASLHFKMCHLLEEMDDGELYYNGNAVCKSLDSKVVYESYSKLKRLWNVSDWYQNFNLSSYECIAKYKCMQLIRFKKG